MAAEPEPPAGHADDHLGLSEKAHLLTGSEGSAGTPISVAWRKEPLSPAEAKKAASIIAACEGGELDRLCELAGSDGGFIEDELRRRAWPILLGAGSTVDASDDWKALPAHRDEHQVDLDVNRAFVYYPHDEDESRMSERRHALTELIVSTLRTHPSLSYFQGYHDIAQVLLLVLGLPAARLPLARLSLLKIRDFMLPTIDGTNSHLELIPAILQASDPQLCRHLMGLQSFFALSATLTMFAHDIEEYGGIARLFDYLIAREAVASVYMYAAIVSLRRDELLEFDAEEPEMLYAILSKLPKPLDLEALIGQADKLMEEHPPVTLPWRQWTRVSNYSVLRTTLPLAKMRHQTLKQGEDWLDAHAQEIRKRQAWVKAIATLKKSAMRYRGPASAVLVAIIVGAVSVWLGKGHHPYVQGLSAFAMQATRRLYDGLQSVLALMV